MNETARKAELTAFLKARRAAVSPESVGIAKGSRRMTPGLRREELASIAGVGLTWYTWLEQGRTIRPSHGMLSRVARALGLSAADDAYLFSLVGAPRPPPVAGRFEVSAALQRVLDAHPLPACVLSPLFDLLAFNKPADRLYEFSYAVGPFDANQLWQFFMNPRRRALYADFASSAQNFVSVFRLNAVSHLEKAYFRELVASLLAASAEFNALWTSQATAPMTPHPVEMNHPELGRVRLSSVRFPLDGDTGAMVVFLAPEDAASTAAWTNTPHTG